MPSYLFDVGNSNDGPIGMCVRVNANNEEEALARLNDVVPEHLDVSEDLVEGEYIAIHINKNNITLKDVGDVEVQE